MKDFSRYPKTGYPPGRFGLGGVTTNAPAGMLREYAKLIEEGRAKLIKSHGWRFLRGFPDPNHEDTQVVHQDIFAKPADNPDRLDAAYLVQYMKDGSWQVYEEGDTVGRPGSFAWDAARANTLEENSSHSTAKKQS